MKCHLLEALAEVLKVHPDFLIHLTQLCLVPVVSRWGLTVQDHHRPLPQGRPGHAICHDGVGIRGLVQAVPLAGTGGFECPTQPAASICMHVLGWELEGK